MDNKLFLKKLAFKLMEEKKTIDHTNPIYIDRLNEELDLILRHDLEGYFLWYAYIIKSLKNKGIFFAVGRGSSSGSLLCYLLRITEIDPIEWNLSFARFLNEGRVANGALPDIDSDIQKSRRPEAVEWIKNTFGEDKVFNVVNFNISKLKTSIKDISRALEIDFQIVNRICKKLDDDTTIEEIDNFPDVVDFLNTYPQVAKFLPKIYGTIKNYGKHAAALVLFPQSIENYMGTVKVGDTICTCWDKSLEGEGFLKIDLLGLKTLDIIKYTLDLTGDKLPRDYKSHPEIFNTINKSPLAIFQMEKPAGLHYIKSAPLQDFTDLYNALALIRPGSKDTGDTMKYIERLKDPSLIKYDHPDLEPILKNTKGLLVFQEQQQEVTRVFGGFSDASSDNIRIAIGKKKMDLMHSYESVFKSGGLNLGYPNDLLVLLWSKLLAAGKYSFNKSHAISYATTSYFTGYLKTYYPVKFLVSVLIHSDKEKRVRIFNELKALDVNIRLPNINESHEHISIEGKNIYIGLAEIDGLGEKAVESIIENRPYKSWDHFIKRKDSRKVHKGIVKALIESGACDEWGKRDYLLGHLDKKPDKTSQTTLDGRVISTNKYKEWTKEEELFHEFKRLRISPNDNLIDLYNKFDSAVELISISKFNKKTLWECSDVYIKALVSSIDQKDGYGFFEVSDGTDTLSIQFNQIQQSTYSDLMSETGAPILIKLHVKYGKPYLNFIIDLREDEKYINETSYIDGSNKEYLIEFRETIGRSQNLGILSSVSYFMSKNGNNCCGFNIQGEKETLYNKITCDNKKGKIPKDLKEGTYVIFSMSGKDFVQIDHSFNLADMIEE